MADLVFRSTTRGGRDYFEVTDDGMIYGGKDRYTIRTDESTNYADTVDEVLAELVFDGAWRINYDKIEVDELGIGEEYKEIVKLIRQKYNWLYNLPKGSKGRQFYFDIGRYFKREIARGTNYNKIFDKVDDVITKNKFEDSKKSIKEARITIDTVWSSLLDGEDYDFVNGILSLADFEQDDAFFIPFSTWGTLTKRAIKLGRWNCKAKFLDEDGNWKPCTIACSVPADADIDDIYSRELPVQAVFIDRF